MQVQFTLEPSDYQAYSRFCLRQSGFRGYMMPRLPALVVLLLLIAWMAWLFVESNGVPFPGASKFILTLEVIALLGVGVVLHKRIAAKRMLRQYLAGTWSATFAPEALYRFDGVTESTTPWQAVQRVGHSPRHLFIVFGYLKGLFIPKRCLPDATTVERILDRIREVRPDLAVETVGRPDLAVETVGRPDAGQ
ncbi:MAG: YcxB family protein [Rhodospirillaceae bacterium]|nr:YcxB family protein [Rhodospirillaceae bacterium]